MIMDMNTQQKGGDLTWQVKNPKSFELIIPTASSTSSTIRSTSVASEVQLRELIPEDARASPDASPSSKSFSIVLENSIGSNLLSVESRTEELMPAQTKCSNHRKHIPVIRPVVITVFRHLLQRRLDSLERRYEQISEKAVLRRARIMKEYEAKHTKLLNLRS